MRSTAELLLGRGLAKPWPLSASKSLLLTSIQACAWRRPALASFVHIPSGSLDLAWPASAREPPTKSAKTPSTSTRGRTDQAQPEQMTKDKKQQPPRAEKSSMTEEARYDQATEQQVNR